MKKGDYDLNWWRKECSIKGLYNEIKKNESIANYTRYENGDIIIKFHNDFTMKISQRYNFDTYINNRFYYDIEEQDIYECIEEIAADKFVIVEHRKKVGY